MNTKTFQRRFFCVLKLLKYTTLCADKSIKTHAWHTICETTRDNSKPLKYFERLNLFKF